MSMEGINQKLCELTAAYMRLLKFQGMDPCCKLSLQADTNSPDSLSAAVSSQQMGKAAYVCAFVSQKRFMGCKYASAQGDCSGRPVPQAVAPNKSVLILLQAQIVTPRTCESKWQPLQTSCKLLQRLGLAKCHLQVQTRWLSGETR